MTVQSKVLDFKWTASCSFIHHFLPEWQTRSIRKEGNTRVTNNNINCSFAESTFVVEYLLLSNSKHFTNTAVLNFLAFLSTKEMLFSHTANKCTEEQKTNSWVALWLVLSWSSGLPNPSFICSLEEVQGLITILVRANVWASLTTRRNDWCWFLRVCHPCLGSGRDRGERFVPEALWLSL